MKLCHVQKLGFPWALNWAHLIRNLIGPTYGAWKLHEAPQREGRHVTNDIDNFNETPDGQTL